MKHQGHEAPPARRTTKGFFWWVGLGEFERSIFWGVVTNHRVTEGTETHRVVSVFIFA